MAKLTPPRKYYNVQKPDLLLHGAAFGSLIFERYNKHRFKEEK